MAQESSYGSTSVAVRVDGELGDLPAEMATPLAVVLAELLQNAIEHAFVDEKATGSPRIDLTFEHGADHYEASVRDNGVGLPEGFDIESTRSLGLAIVRDLVRTQLSGSITMATDRGTLVRLTIPARGPQAGWR
jgi:two-component sensor histidine kinase